LAALTEDRARFEGLGRRDTISALERRFERYPTHHHVLQLRADTNVTENVIKQLGKKLRLMVGFATVESAERFSHLLVGCYRFKRFTGSGRSPPPSTTAFNHRDSNTRCDAPGSWVRQLLQIQGRIA
jgi:hypothetical protein